MSKVNIYSVKEFSKITGVATHTLRNLDNSGEFIANRDVAGNRYYIDEHVKVIVDNRQADVDAIIARWTTNKVIIDRDITTVDNM